MRAMINKAQLTAIHTLLGKLNLKDDKKEIIKQFTNGRTDSSRMMRGDEAAALIGHLKSNDPTEVRIDKMRNKVISMAHEMNWRIPGTTKIDMAHLNNWCLTRSYLKKKLDDYGYKELPGLVTQFERVYSDHLKGIVSQ